jgi:hypothetical protein
MFLYKLYHFGFHTQKAFNGTSSKHFISSMRMLRPNSHIPTKEDIFSRVPAVFVIALGNYLVPCVPVQFHQSVE